MENDIRIYLVQSEELGTLWGSGGGGDTILSTVHTM